MNRFAESELVIETASVDSLRRVFQEHHRLRSQSDNVDWLKHAGRMEIWQLGRLFLISRIRQLMLQRSSCGTAPQLDEFDIVSRNGLGRGTQPRVYLRGRIVPWRVSLSHTDDMFALAIVGNTRSRVGVDLVDATVAQPQALRLWCTPHERRSLAHQDDQTVLQIWAMKEAVFKAVNRGEAFCPSHFEIHFESDQTECYWRKKRLPLDVAVIRPVPDGKWLAAVVVSPASQSSQPVLPRDGIRRRTDWKCTTHLC